MNKQNQGNNPNAGRWNQGKEGQNSPDTQNYRTSNIRTEQDDKDNKQRPRDNPNQMDDDQKT